MSRYQPGQKVRVVKQERDSGRFRNYFNIEMAQYSQKVVTLYRQYSKGIWSIEEDGHTWRWTDDMFTPLVQTTDPDEAFKMYLVGHLSEEQYEVVRRERG